MRSRAAAFQASMCFCTTDAVEGMIESPEQVATRIRSRSFTVLPAAASARRPATAASSDASTWLIRRSLIPVRVVIHSSEVSTSCSRSWLVSTLGGMHMPQPVISAFLILVSSVSAHRNDGIQRGPDVVDSGDGVHCGALDRSCRARPAVTSPGPTWMKVSMPAAAMSSKAVGEAGPGSTI